MEAHFPYIALWLAFWIALGLAFWAAFGGRIGRWIAACLLVWWIVWVGHVTIRNAYPHWLYTPEERVYMARLVEAIKVGRTRVPLQELVPFEWYAMCWIDRFDPYHEPDQKWREHVKKLTGEDVLGRLSLGEGAQLMIFATSNGVVTIDPYWWMFGTWAPESSARFYGKQLGERKFDLGFDRLKEIQSRWGWECYAPDQLDILVIPNVSG